MQSYHLLPQTPFQAVPGDQGSSVRLESDELFEFPIILTGVPRDRSYLIFVRGKPGKIGLKKTLPALLELIIGNANNRNGGYCKLDAKGEAYPLRQIIGDDFIDEQGGWYRLLVQPRCVGIDPTFFDIPNDEIVPSVKERVRGACTVFPAPVFRRLLTVESDSRNED